MQNLRTHRAGCILQEELNRSADQLEVDLQRERGVRDEPVVLPPAWNCHQVSLEACREAGVLGKLTPCVCGNQEMLSR